MSQIFDALHQSTTERPGNGSREFSDAKDLLQVVEAKVASSPARVEQPPRRPVRESFPSARVTLSGLSRFVCFTDTESLPAEKFRFLATRLRHMQQKRTLKRLVITSSVAGEGKSMVSANLACALAAGKQKVLLVEGDLRRPSLGRDLNLGKLPGLCEMLENPQGLGSIYRLEGSGLCVLLAGDSQANAMEVMEAGRLSKLIDLLAVDFDWLVIDSAPVLPLADTSIWMRMADAVMLVTRPGITAKRQLQKTIEAIEQSKLLGCVINASSEATTNHYYSQYTSRSAGVHLSSATAK
jgi:capsular exopolysaccharide synthesis family protein